MKASELIAQLQKLKDEIGDLEVVTTIWSADESVYHHERLIAPCEWKLSSRQAVIKIDAEGFCIPGGAGL